MLALSSVSLRSRIYQENTWRSHLSSSWGNAAPSSSFSFLEVFHELFLLLSKTTMEPWEFVRAFLTWGQEPFPDSFGFLYLRVRTIESSLLWSSSMSRKSSFSRFALVSFSLKFSIWAFFMCSSVSRFSMYSRSCCSVRIWFRISASCFWTSLSRLEYSPPFSCLPSLFKPKTTSRPVYCFQSLLSQSWHTWPHARSSPKAQGRCLPCYLFGWLHFGICRPDSCRPPGLPDEWLSGSTDATLFISFVMHCSRFILLFKSEFVLLRELLKSLLSIQIISGPLLKGN